MRYLPDRAATVEGCIVRWKVAHDRSAVNKKRVLFICTGNSARSQMAEALLRHEAGHLYEIGSAGTHPAAVRPEAVTVMREISVDISAQRSKPISTFQGFFKVSNSISLLLFATRPVKSAPFSPERASGSIGHSKTRPASLRWTKNVSAPFEGCATESMRA